MHHNSPSGYPAYVESFFPGISSKQTIAGISKTIEVKTTRQNNINYQNYGIGNQKWKESSYGEIEKCQYNPYQQTDYWKPEHYIPNIWLSFIPSPACWNNC